MKVHDMLARVFLQEGVETVFALLGDANINWAADMAARGAGLIQVRHEHCAVAAAMAHARKTGRPGVASTTCGPGLTQVLTALPAAVRARIPLVIFAGETPLGARWYNQAIEQGPLITATGARYRALHSPHRMAVAVRDAFVEAIRDRVPVVLGVPMDLQKAVWSGAPDLPPPAAACLPALRPLTPHPDELTDAAARIGAARRIVLLAGLGAVEAGAGPACRALADHLGALTATTLPARGLFHDDPFHIGVAGGFSTAAARRLMGQADLVLAVGCSLSHHTADGGALHPEAHVLQIDTAPVVENQGRVAAHSHLRADARLGARALLRATGPAGDGWRGPEVARLLRDTRPDDVDHPAEPGVHHPQEVVDALDRLLPADWETVNASGHCAFYTTHMYRRPQERFLVIREFGAIGNGPAFVMGVAAARPDRPAVLLDGDGGLLMHVQELETIRRHGMNVIICVLNDGAYGSEIHKLRAEGLPGGLVSFGRPDFASIARSFGWDGARVDNLRDLPGLIARHAKTGGPTLWDFPISDRIVSPLMRRSTGH